jgi:hypothetical protein
MSNTSRSNVPKGKKRRPESTFVAAATGIAGGYALNNFELPTNLRLKLKAEIEAKLNAKNATTRKKGAMKTERRMEEKQGTKAFADSASDDLLSWHEPSLSIWPTPNPPPGTVHRVFKRAEIEAQFANSLSNLRSAEVRDAKRLRSICVHLAKQGEYRRVGILQADWAKNMQDLRVRFPNFERVIALVSAMFLLQAKNAIGKQAIPMPRLYPILLDGAPGIGKSLFAEALAECFQLPFYRFDLGSMHTSGALTGSDEMFSNSKPGKVFQTILQGDYANPFFVLDELDKMPRDKNLEPDGALLTL